MFSKWKEKLYFIRGQRVMLDSDLAKLYQVDTKRLNEQVNRNLDRFPSDFMFQLNSEEVGALRSQFATSKKGRGGRRYQPLVFTENGVAMLSSILNSKQAIQVNIAIMRIFTQLRSFHMLEKDLSKQVQELRDDTSKLFKIVFKLTHQRGDSIASYSLSLSTYREYACAA